MQHLHLPLTHEDIGEIYDAKNRNIMDVWFRPDAESVSLGEELGEDYLQGRAEAIADEVIRRVNQHDELIALLRQCLIVLNAIPNQAVPAISSQTTYRLAAAIDRNVKAEVDATYSLARIAWELERTALGDSYYGNALRVAKDIPGVTAEERALLDRYATGAEADFDRFALQDLALRIDRMGSTNTKENSA